MAPTIFPPDERDPDVEPCAYAFLDNIFDSTCEKQHWTMSGTPYERHHPAEIHSPEKIGLYFPHIRNTSPVKLDKDVCQSLIAHDPIAGFKFWQELYREHIPNTIDYPLWTWTNELMVYWGTSFDLSFLRLSGPGLSEFFEEIVSREEFFYDFPALVLNIFKMIALTLKTAKTHFIIGLADATTIKDAMNRLVALACRVTWEHRSRLLVEPDVLDDHAGLLRLARTAVHGMLVGYCQLHCPTDPNCKDNDIDYSVFRHVDYEYIRRLTFFMWFHYDESIYTGDFKRTPEGEAFLLTTVVFTLRVCGAEDPEPTAFVQSDIIPEYDAQAVLGRLAATLRRSKMSDSTFLRILDLVQLLLLRSEFFPHFASAGVLGAFRDTLDVSRLDNITSENALMVNILEIYRVVAAHAPTRDGRAPLIRQHDVIGLLSRCVIVAAMHGYPYSERGREYVFEYITYARALLQRHGEKNALRQALIRSVRWHWYHALKELRGVERVRPEVTKGCIHLENTWMTFGKVLGLDEATEKRDYYQRAEKGASQLCAWENCRYHTVRPPAPLSTCKGCGEVYYCGRGCQVRDWKEGHRQVCKRIKDEAHRPA
ncbi:unnamed protein product [Peniophora sp. CBMAI 1063]|nr:unnamed protein product [Peniophora sp. CBMAI 1063]